MFTCVNITTRNRVFFCLLKVQHCILCSLTLARQCWMTLPTSTYKEKLALCNSQRPTTVSIFATPFNGCAAIFTCLQWFFGFCVVWFCFVLFLKRYIREVKNSGKTNKKWKTCEKSNKSSQYNARWIHPEQGRTKVSTRNERIPRKTHMNHGP